LILALRESFFCRCTLWERMVPDMDRPRRTPTEVIESAVEMVERTKALLRSADDRLRISRLQIERSRQLLERFADLETGLKKRARD